MPEWASEQAGGVVPPLARVAVQIREGNHGSSPWLAARSPISANVAVRSRSLTPCRIGVNHPASIRRRLVKAANDAHVV